MDTRQRKPSALLLALLALTLPLAPAFAQEAAQTDETEADPVVLRVGDEEERLGEFNDRFEIAVRGLVASQGIPMTPEIRAQLEGLKVDYLEQRVTEIALLQEAEERGIAVTDEEVEDRIAQLRASLAEGEELGGVLEQAGFRDEQQLRELLTETELIQRTVTQIGEQIEVSDAEIASFYSENPTLFEQPEQVCARHILVEELDTANELLGELEGGADFAETAAEHSTDPGSGARGGDLGCFPRGRMVQPFEEAAFSAPLNEVVGPVESQFGQHLILVYDRQEAGQVPLAQVEPQIANQLRQQKLNDAIEQVVEDADVERFTEHLEAPAPADAPAPEEPTAPEAPADPQGDGEPAGEDGLEQPAGEGSSEQPAGEDAPEQPAGQ